MLSISQNRSSDLTEFRTSVKSFRDSEDALKERVEKFFKEGEFKRHVIEVQEDCDNLEVIVYGRKAVEVLRRRVSLGTWDDCMPSFFVVENGM